MFGPSAKALPERLVIDLDTVRRNGVTPKILDVVKVGNKL